MLVIFLKEKLVWEKLIVPRLKMNEKCRMVTLQIPSTNHKIKTNKI